MINVFKCWSTSSQTLGNGNQVITFSSRFYDGPWFFPPNDDRYNFYLTLESIWRQIIFNYNIIGLKKCCCHIFVSWLSSILGIWVGSGSSLSWKRSQRPLVFSDDVHWSVPEWRSDTPPHHYIFFLIIVISFKMLKKAKSRICFFILLLQNNITITIMIPTTTITTTMITTSAIDVNSAKNCNHIQLSIHHSLSTLTAIGSELATQRLSLTHSSLKWGIWLCSHSII